MDAALALLMFLLLSYLGKSLIYGLFFVPMYFQWQYLKIKSTDKSKLLKTAVKVFCFTYFMSFFFYLLSLNYSMNAVFYQQDMSEFKRALVSTLFGLVFSLTMSLFEFFSKKEI